MNAISGGLGKLATVAGGAALAGITALGAGLASSIGAAFEAQDGLVELEAVLESTGGVAGVTAQAAQDLATSFQNITRFSDDAILSGENMLLTFTNIGSNVFPEATESMLNMAQKFGSMETASVLLGKALNDPIAGVSALRRVGVQLTEAQEESIKTFMEQGDIAGAQKVILAELQTEFGGLAVAAGTTAAGKLDIFWNKLGDVQEKIGGAFIPAISLLADKFSTWIDTPGFQAGIDAITRGINDVMAVLQPLISGEPELALQNFQGALSRIGFNPEQVGGISESLVSIIESADKISVAFGKMFSPENIGGATAMVGLVKGLADAMEKIALSAEGIEQVMSAFSGGGVEEGLKEVGNLASKEFQVRPDSFAGDFVEAVKANPASAASLATGGLAAIPQTIDLAALGQMIVSAFQSAPPPQITVSATLDGQQIAGNVEQRIVGDMRGLGRITGR